MDNLNIIAIFSKYISLMENKSSIFSSLLISDHNYTVSLQAEYLRNWIFTLDLMRRFAMLFESPIPYLQPKEKKMYQSSFHSFQNIFSKMFLKLQSYIEKQLGF